MPGITLDMRLDQQVKVAILAIPDRLTDLTLVLGRIAVRLEGGEDAEMLALAASVTSKAAELRAAIDAASSPTTP